MRTLFEHYRTGETLYEKYLQTCCEKHHLTYMEYTVLLFLANNPRYDTAAELVRFRHLTKSHVSMSVRTLCEKHLVTGVHRGSDHRTVHLSLTEDAVPIIEDGRAAQKRFYDALFAGFSEEEKAEYLRCVVRMDENIETAIRNF